MQTLIITLKIWGTLSWNGQKPPWGSGRQGQHLEGNLSTLSRQEREATEEEPETRNKRSVRKNKSPASSPGPQHVLWDGPRAEGESGTGAKLACDGPRVPAEARVGHTDTHTHCRVQRLLTLEDKNHEKRTNSGAWFLELLMMENWAHCLQEGESRTGLQPMDWKQQLVFSSLSKSAAYRKRNETWLVWWYWHGEWVYYET